MREYEYIKISSPQKGYAGITEKLYKGFGGQYLMDLEWVGGKTLPVYVDWRLIEKFAPGFLRTGEISGFPWPLAVIGDCPWRREVLCVRTDAGVSFRAVFHRLKFKLNQNCRLLKTRAIMTLNVWNLAFTSPGYIPQWKDIGLVNRICVKITAILGRKDQNGKQTKTG